MLDFHDSGLHNAYWRPAHKQLLVRQRDFWLRLPKSKSGHTLLKPKEQSQTTSQVCVWICGKSLCPPCSICTIQPSCIPHVYYHLTTSGQSLCHTLKCLM